MRKERTEERVNELIGRSLGSLNDIVNVNTVIGTPIVTASGYQVIPVSKVTLGYLGGGSDLRHALSQSVVKEDESIPFAGGSGAVVSMKPAGFIFDDGKSCRYIHAGDDPIDNLIDKASDLLKHYQGKNCEEA